MFPIVSLYPTYIAVNNGRAETRAGSGPLETASVVDRRARTTRAVCLARPLHDCLETGTGLALQRLVLANRDRRQPGGTAARQLGELGAKTAARLRPK